MVTVSMLTPTVNWDESTPIIYGTPIGETHLNASADVEGSFIYSVEIGDMGGQEVMSQYFVIEMSLVRLNRSPARW